MIPAFFLFVIMLMTRPEDILNLFISRVCGVCMYVRVRARVCLCKLTQLLETRL